MRSIRGILRIIRTGLALYGGYCLITGMVGNTINKNWNEIKGKMEDEVSKLIFGEGYKCPIEVEYKVEDVR